jgi:hypothetical protein
MALDHGQRRKGLAAAVSLLMLAAACGVVGGAAMRALEGDGVRGPPRMTADAWPQVVPLLRDGVHVRVSVSWGQGVPPLQMLLDTGAPTIIPARIAQMLDAAAAGRSAVRAPGAAARSMDVVTLPALRLGRVVFRDVRAIVKNGAGIGPPSALVSDGVLGADFLQAGVWQLDQEAGTLTIADDVTSLDHVAGATALDFLPATGASPSPVVELGIGGVPCRFLLDTGSDNGLVLHRDDLESSVSTVATTVTVQTWDETRHASVQHVLAEVGIGPETPRRTRITVTDTLERGLGLIGNAFLARYVLTIDWPSRRVYLEG